MGANCVAVIIFVCGTILFLVSTTTRMVGLTFLSMGGLFFGGTILYLFCGDIYLNFCMAMCRKNDPVLPEYETESFNDIREQD